MWGSHLSQPPRGEDSLLNCAVPGTSSRTGENPPYGILGGAAGDVAMGAGLRPSPKGVEPPPDPTVRAPVPHPTRSEANCLTSGCKSRRRRSPCGAVVISGSPRGDPWAGSPDVKAPGGRVDFEPPRSGQHRGRATGRAVARANGLTAEMGPRTKLIQAEHRRCQECLPSTRWPVPARKDGAVPVSDLPADVEGGNPGEPSSESSEGLVARQDDPRMSKTVPITGHAGKWPGGDQTGG